MGSETISFFLLVMNMGGKGKQKQKGSNWFEEFQTNTKFKTQVTFKPCFQALSVIFLSCQVMERPWEQGCQ